MESSAAASQKGLPTMPGDFENRVALVTGGSRGIGRATALQLARGGANVAIGYGSRRGPAEEVVAEIRALGRKALCAACDVTQQTQIDAIVNAARKELGPIDLLCHCGAISNIAQ